jgi:hypothetical protein
MALDPLFDYPLPDKHDLIKVSQYIALTIDGSTPKEIVAKIIKDAGYPDFQKPDEPHMALAELPLPLYITTNYDDFMFQALKRTGRKDPQLFINRWNETKGEAAAGDSSSDINPTELKPAVYYFHGHKDYLDTHGADRGRLSRLPGPHIARSNAHSTAHSGGDRRDLPAVYWV